ncbi:hypothetical protein Bhyg_12553 [Pseudolycoriella hygida]|uniref:Uncharacterized protein n=1 Tax=Pseudolycoriella hygida TaxID=35572 RepID=A0A9Q0MXF6_9DIPT|nr:hypothetical protein Bhyg_12553 [Pseudolycoriella hygida]
MIRSYLGSNIQSEHIKHYVTKYQFYQQLLQAYATGKSIPPTDTLYLKGVEVSYRQTTQLQYTKP